MAGIIRMNTYRWIPGHTPADVLQVLLLDRWSTPKGDRDRFLHHQIDLEKDNQRFLSNRHPGCTGDTDERTAMSKTVSLPLGIFG